LDHARHGDVMEWGIGIPVRDHLGGKRLMAAGRKRRCQGRFRQYDEAVSMVWS
jgi:hypothetical protein